MKQSDKPQPRKIPTHTHSPGSKSRKHASSRHPIDSPYKINELPMTPLFATFVIGSLAMAHAPLEVYHLYRDLMRRKDKPKPLASQPVLHHPLRHILRQPRQQPLH